MFECVCACTGLLRAMYLVLFDSFHANVCVCARGKFLTLTCTLPCVCVCSDLCTAFGKDVMKLVELRPQINDLLTEGRRSKTSKTKTLATWATKELRKLKSQAW